MSPETKRGHPAPETTTRLREWRLKAGYTLTDVHGLSGLSPAMLSRAERHLRILAPATKVRLARSLGVQVADLFELESEIGLQDEDFGGPGGYDVPCPAPHARDGP